MSSVVFYFLNYTLVQSQKEEDFEIWNNLSCILIESSWLLCWKSLKAETSWTISVETDEESLDLMEEWLNSVSIVKVLIMRFADRSGLNFKERGKV